MIFKYEQIYLNFIRMHLSLMHAHMYDHCQHAFWYEFQWLCSVNSSSTPLTHSLILEMQSQLTQSTCILSSIYKINSNKICVKSNDVVPLPWVSEYVYANHVCILKRDVCEVTLCDVVYSSLTMESTSEKGIENGKQMLVYMIFNYR